MKLLFSFAATLAIVFCSPAVAETISLEELTSDGRSITSGDKLFDQFDYEATGNMPSAEFVSVSTFTDEDGNWGITFQGGFLDRPGNGQSNATISYQVTVLDTTKEISAAHIFGYPSVIGGGYGTMKVTETFPEDVPAESLIIHHVSPGGGLQLVDSANFANHYTTLHVRTDIHADAHDGSAASMSAIDQTFSQVLVPEPSVAVILITGFALLGCCFVRRNRR